LIQTIALPERDFIIRHNSTNFIPLEDLADIVELHNVTDVGGWLRDALQYPQDYVDEFFARFPDLAARFLVFLGLDIPSAHAQAPQPASAYGWSDYGDTPPNVKLDGVLWHGQDPPAGSRPGSTTTIV